MQAKSLKTVKKTNFLWADRRSSEQVALKKMLRLVQFLKKGSIRGGFWTISDEKRL